MSPAKKKADPVSVSRLPKLASLFTGWGKYVLIGLLIAGVLAAAGYKIREFVRGKVLLSEEYQLTPEKILLKPWPMPSWVQPDPRLEVFEQLRRRGPISIADEDLVERVTAVFEQNPWIAKVHRVAKKFPATIEVELDFRKPVLMVVIDTPVSKDYYAVDAEGISLPTTLGCFNPVEIAKYPQLIGVDKPPSTGMGKRWGDSRVIGGAEIAAALTPPLWEKLRLRSIAPRAISPRAGNSGETTQSPQFGDYHFDIIAQGMPQDIRFYWRKSPMDKNSSDLSPAQKVKKLEALAAEFGGLDKCPEKYRDLNQP
jgi:hypothetical protein